MSTSPAAPEVFTHVRVMMSIVLGLGLARLLTGLARFIQHPSQYEVYPVHVGWVLTMLLTLVHFWWWEFGLINFQHWTF